MLKKMLYEDGLPVDPRRLPGADRAGVLASEPEAAAKAARTVPLRSTTGADGAARNARHSGSSLH
jgi:hypothetical protein